MGEARCSRAGASGARTIHRQAAGTFFFHLSVHGIPCRKTVVGHKWSTTSHTDEVRGNVFAGVDAAHVPRRGEHKTAYSAPTSGRTAKSAMASARQ